MAEIKKVMFPDTPENERAEILDGIADKIETGTYVRQLDDNEIRVAKDILSERMIERNRLDQELDKIKKEFKAKIDPLNKEIFENMDIIRTGQEEKEGTLFLIADQDTGVMASYDERGYLVNTRMIRPDERGTIMQVVRNHNLSQLNGQNDYEVKKAQ